MKYLVLGLGNDLLGDDAVGPQIVRRLADLDGAEVHVAETAESGVTLLDLFVGFKRALVIDGIITGKRPPGTLMELRLPDLRSTPGPSPHYSGLPELVELAARMHLEFPEEFVILAVELAEAHIVGGEMSSGVRAVIPPAVRRVREIITAWHLKDRQQSTRHSSRRVVNA